MNNNILSHYYPSKNKNTYNILGDLKLDITITSNPFDIPMDQLFAMAARINKKRSFLFVSKVLGKHIPVNPYVSLLSGVSLALLLVKAVGGSYPTRLTQLAIQGLLDPSQAKSAYNEIMDMPLITPQPLKFIGFAETATAIGHSVYQAFDEHCSYIHTSREQIIEMPSMLNFEEEHSHATSHRCYARHPEFIAGEESIVLVDDEITTGNTSINIIRDIHAQFPRKCYYLLSLLDWRTPEDQRKFAALERELGITITTIALVKGEIEVSGASPLMAPTSHLDAQDHEECPNIRVVFLDQCFEHLHVTSEDGQGKRSHSPYLKYSGRFGVESGDHPKIDASITQAADVLKEARIGAKTLCMGTGEFMYLPMRIAAQMGDGVLYQSTTRSPIHPSDTEHYAVSSAYRFPSPDDPEINHYLYNISQGSYDDFFLLLEREVEPSAIKPLLEILKTLKFKQINLVFCSPGCLNWEEIISQ
ncbi:hypothetical protein D3C73_664570 [compost metagenome]